MKTLRYFLTPTFIFVLILLIVVVVSFDASTRTVPGEEIIKDKPTISKGLLKQTPAFQNGATVGDLFPAASLFDADLANDGSEVIYLYAWIWKESVRMLDNEHFQISEEENIRIASNQSIIGRLKEGTTGISLHSNSRNSWVLARFDLEVPQNVLTEENTSFFSSDKTQRTMTTKDAGELPDAASELELLTVLLSFAWSQPLRFIALVFAVLLGWGSMYYGIRFLFDQVRKRRTGVSKIKSDKKRKS